MENQEVYNSHLEAVILRRSGLATHLIHLRTLTTETQWHLWYAANGRDDSAEHTLSINK